MGLFKVKVGIGIQRNGARVVFPESLDLLVDTGATYTTIPKYLLEKLGAEPVGEMPVRLADGRIVEKKYGGIWLNILGRPVSVTVLFGDENDIPILGATSLEQAGFGVDPVTKQLIPTQAIQASVIKNFLLPFGKPFAPSP